MGSLSYSDGWYKTTGIFASSFTNTYNNKNDNIVLIIATYLVTSLLDIVNCYRHREQNCRDQNDEFKMYQPISTAPKGF